MALNRVHGQVSAGAFYGYSPLVIKVADSATTSFSADTVNATTGAITDGGYSKAVRAIQSLGRSIVHSVIHKLGELRKQKARPKPGF